MKIDINLRELFDMANIMNSGINGQISDLFAGFGTQVQNNLKDALLGLCSDLEIDAGTFKKTWDANYSMTTGVILGDAVVVKKEQAAKKERNNTGKKPVGKSAYHFYLAKWREAKKDGNDNRTFADVRSDWGNLSQEEKDSYKSEDSVSEASPVSTSSPSPSPEPQQAETQEEEAVDESIPKINGIPLIEKEWTVAKLKLELKARSLKQSGKKSELVQRLIDSFSQDDESEEEESEEEDSSEDEESSDEEDSDEEEEDEDEDDIDNIEAAVEDIIKEVTANNNDNNDEELSDEEQLSDEDVSDDE